MERWMFEYVGLNARAKTILRRRGWRRLDNHEGPHGMALGCWSTPSGVIVREIVDVEVDAFTGDAPCSYCFTCLSSEDASLDLEITHWETGVAGVRFDRKAGVLFAPTSADAG